MKPQVSVIILTKDRAAFLEKALSSVQGQNFLSKEILVINDGSSDNTLLVLSGLQKTLPELRVVSHEKSLGISLSRREAVEICRGDYVAFLDDDDEWVDPEKLSLQVKYLNNHPQTVLTGGGIEIVAGGRKVWRAFRPEQDGSIRRSMLFRNNFFTSTVMFRRSAALAAGSFVKDGPDLAEDYDLWLRLGKRGKMYNFPRVFARYRQPEYNKAKRLEFFYKQARLVKDYQRQYPYGWLARLVLFVRTFFIKLV